jgi:uncharacterized protein
MQLSAAEVRILGSLIEKEATTPDVYPLSLNALTAACNQTSNRDPVMDLSEDAVRWAVNNLRQQSLVRAVQGSGSRVMKFQHLVAERLDLDAPALGALCVLLLRGPQTAGEVRGRAQRLAEFATVADAEAALGQLREKDLAVELSRRPGQKEARWAHLLSGPPPADAGDSAESTAPVREEPRDETDQRVAGLEAKVSDLESRLAQLRTEFEALKRQFE